jgi:8-oxo-dGTP pyrophosphatase MutT (NUDIX family)
VRGRSEQPVDANPLHTDAVAVLSAWESPDAAQEVLRLDYLAHLSANPDGVWRSCPTAHLTASTIVLDPSGRRTALVLHGRIGLWVQPGGHCEPDDGTVAAAAAREAREETGLGDLVVSAAPIRLSRHGAPCGVAEHHLDVQYLGITPATGVPVVSEESHDVRWFDVDHLPDDLASGVAFGVATAAAALAALARG